MDRRKFVEKSSLMLLALSTSSYSSAGLEVDFEEIVGRKKPQLFGDGFRLRKEAAEAFSTLKADAFKDGVDIYTVSSYRSFADQKRIWDNKYKRFTRDGLEPIDAIKKIIEYSTMPGTSRHHWGTDLDIIDGAVNVEGDRLLAELFQRGRPYSNLKNWLNENAEKYGFYEVYTNHPNRRGFKYEPWHFSYRPLSMPFLKNYMEIDFSQLLRGLDISGSEYFTKRFIQRYWKENMLDINPDLIPA